MRRAASIVVVFFCGLVSAFGYALEGTRWPGPTIPMVVQLGTPSFVLPDGFATWNADAEDCFQIWNQEIANAQFTWTEAPPYPPASQYDGRNSVQFSRSLFGRSYGSGVLAVTVYFFDNGFSSEADVNFNSAINWSSGALVRPDNDFHRVALHEFGHVLGLDHPDENHRSVNYVAPAVPAPAIMFAYVSQLHDVTADDIAGATYLYGAPANPPPPAFFADETAISNGVYHLQFPSGNSFGYYSYLSDPRHIYHFDMGYEYLFDASDGMGGIYFYDFASSTFFYTSPSFPFPYLYDFSLNAVLYYYPDASNSGHYSTNPRYFYNFATGQIITK